MFSVLNNFLKCSHFFYLLQNVEPERQKLVGISAFFLLVEPHSHFNREEKKDEISLLLTSVPWEKILAMCQNRTGSFPSLSAKQWVKQPHQMACKYCSTTGAGQGTGLKGGSRNVRIQMDCTVLKLHLFLSAQ